MMMTTTIRRIFTMAVALTAVSLAVQVHAGTITGTPLITGDADSGIDAANFYTHKLDFGTTRPASPIVNGVQFDSVGASGAIGVFGWNTNIPNDSAANDNTGVAAGGIHTLLQDFRHNAPTATLSLTGMTAGATYDARIYYRQWGAGNRTNTITFDEGGGAPKSMDINPDAANEAHYVSFQYTAASDVGSAALPLNVTFAECCGNGNATWHLYGVTNQVVGAIPPPPATPLPITDLYNTGVDNAGNALVGGTPAAKVTDPHYQVLEVGGAAVNFAAFLAEDDDFPIPPWVLNNANSRWIDPAGDADSNGAAGSYIYRTTFTVPAEADLSLIAVRGEWASDNAGSDILINGVSTGQTSAALDSFTAFSITSDFVHGTNTLDFLLSNAGAGIGPTGLRVDNIRGVYLENPIPEPTSLALAALGVLGLLGWGRRRKR